MEFEGRISKVMPTRTGQRQDGSEWKALPFVFEYFENETGRFPDSVLLETTDHDTMRNIGQFVARGEDKKAIVKDGQCVLTGEIKCRCGFSHRVNTFRCKDGSGEGDDEQPAALQARNHSHCYRVEHNYNAAIVHATATIHTSNRR